MTNIERSDRVILVTGASSGIGRSCAELFAERGERVFGTAREPRRHRAAGFALVEMEVTEAESVNAAVAAIVAEAGQIDVVVNNAGISLVGAVEDTSLEEAQRLFDVNFFGALRVCKAVLPHMRARERGLIINVGSLGGLVGLPYQGLYSASKFALEGLTESLRHELETFGVRVTIVEPGDVATAITTNRVIAQSARSGDYKTRFDRVLGIVAEDERSGASARRVAELVVRVSEQSSPAPRHTVGQLSQRASAWAKRVLPARVFERVIRSYYRL
jgi:NAD(P)-dependent dehydrogenase (short-subunit alcohol dehydrogenase family)